MKGRKKLSCREARREMQELLDRADLVSAAGGESLLRFARGELRAHLDQCRECSDFFKTLSSFAPVLLAQLDGALRNHSAPAFEAVLRRQKRSGQPVPPERNHAGSALAAALQTARRRLFGPLGKPAAVLRWAAVCLAGALLVSVIALRVHRGVKTQRAIEAQIDRVVELIYEEPLFSGIESALLRTHPTISDYMEDMSLAVEALLEPAGQGTAPR